MIFPKILNKIMSRQKMKEEDKKPSITININENLLKKIDSLVKNSGDIRSRLIEKLLLEYIEKNKNNVPIL